MFAGMNIKQFWNLLHVMHCVEKIFPASEYHLPIRIPVMINFGLRLKIFLYPFEDYDVVHP